MSVVQLELNEELSEERNYSRTVSQVEPRMVRRNDWTEGLIGMGICIRTSWMPNHQVILEAQSHSRLLTGSLKWRWYLKAETVQSHAMGKIPEHVLGSIHGTIYAVRQLILEF